SMPYRDFAMTEARFSLLSRTHPEASERFMRLSQQDVTERYRHYRELADKAFTAPAEGKSGADAETGKAATLKEGGKA
ncbi:MAG: hypothetical protein ACXWTN_09805, partial [Methylosarcina sp.]